MNDVTIWLVILFIGIIVFMAGVLMPRRELQVVGAIAAIVGAIGWLVVALN